MKTHSFTKECRLDGEPVILYGAGACGRLALASLRQWGLTASFFCDRSFAGSELEGIRVLSPEDLRQHPGAHVLIASSTFFQEMLEQLESLQHARCYDVLELLTNPELLLGQSLEAQFDIHNLVSTYLFEVRYKSTSKKTNLFTLDVVVTERCSLRCKDCANAMQYYEKPGDCSLQTIEASLDRYLECVDYLPRAFFIGGEPFMNRDLYQLIHRYGGHPKIGAIWIFTNGSILPDRKHLDAMKRHGVMVRLSDYGALVKNKEAFLDTLESEGIPYSVVGCDVWQDLGPMTDRHYSLEGLQATYQACECRDLFTLLKGRLYHCPWSAHGDNLGMIEPLPDDCIDLLDGDLTTQQIERKLRYLKHECLGVAACGYCNGRGPSTPSIPAAIQRPR